MNLGNYIKWLKPYCKRKRISDEEFVNELISPLVCAENILDKEGKDLYLDKSRVSNILNHKDDVPEALRKAAIKKGIENKISDDFKYFYKNQIATSRDKELLDEFTSYIKNDSISDKEKKAILSDDPCTLLLKLFLSTIKEDNKAASPENMIVWRRGKSYIKIAEGDLFKKGFDKRNKNNRIVVIPVNTSFETRLTADIEKEVNPLVSRETIHGEFLNRLYIKQLSPAQISKRIRMNLEKNYAIQKDSNYPIGTIATLKFDNTLFFLVAVSKFDKKNVARSTKKDIEVAVEKLAQYYDEKGQGYDIFIPLMGTGLSRANLENQESYDIIKNTLLNNKDKLQGKINIVILPDVIDEIQI